MARETGSMNATGHGGSSGSRGPRATWGEHASTVALVALATGAGALWRSSLAPPDLVALYLMTIMVSAAFFGRGPSLLAATLSVLAYDFFFIPPVFAFVVDDQRHVLTFAVMFAVGLLISGLTLRVRRHERAATAREQRTAALYLLSRDLSASLNTREVAAVLARHTQSTFQAIAAVFTRGADQHLSMVAEREQQGTALGQAEIAALRWAYDHACRAGQGTEVFPHARVTGAPLRAGTESLGVLALLPPIPALGAEQWQLLDAFTGQAALALGRAQSAEAAEAAVLRARTEEMRSALLSTVSHDLRTPLAAITGAATTLREARPTMSQCEANELLDTISEEADRLERLVRNLLDMTRVEAGALEVKREWVSLEEIVGSALSRFDSKLTGRAVRTALPADLPLVSADPVLLEQVFVNLFENATKYTPSNTPIEVSGHAEHEGVVVEVADRGPGLPEGSEAHIFAKFFRAKRGGSSGAGLGLAICRGIVEAHAGTLVAENRAGGGAIFRLRLPAVGLPPTVPGDVESGAGRGDPES